MGFRLSSIVALIRLLLAALLMLAATPSLAQTFPPLTGVVVDNANKIPDDFEAELTVKLKAFEKESGRQFVVATIADMQGYDLADYGYRLGRAWKIGQKSRNNGVLLFLAPNERMGKRGPRIEVGYGLEPIITDAFASRLAKGVMSPLLRAEDMRGALTQGTDAIIAQLRLSPDEAAAKDAAAKPMRQSQGDVSLSTVLFWMFFFFFFILPMIRGIFGGRRGRSRRYSSGPVIIWGGGSDWGGGGSSWGNSGGFGGGDGGGFSGGGGSFGGGGASGDW